MRWIKRLLGAVLALAGIALLGWMAIRIHLSRPAATASQHPRGYDSRREIVAAIATGALKLENLNPPLPPNVTEEKSVVYGRIGNRNLELDLYAPAEVKGPCPALLFIHGGAWKGGKREDYRVYTTHFASLGYVAATASYRLSGESPFPAAVEDVKCAVRWLRSNASQRNIDPKRIAVIGGSAGGHLSMMVGFSPGKLEGSGGNSGVSSEVAAVVNIYGPSDLTTEFAQKAGVVKSFLGNQDYASASERWIEASPIHHLTPKAPPTLILHGTLDDIVPIDQSDTLAARMKTMGIPVEYERLEGWPHTMDVAAPVNAYFKGRIADFLKKNL